MTVTTRIMRRSIGAAVALALAAVPVVASAATYADRPGGRQAAAPLAGVPAGFRASSMTWISPRRGWVLGARSCGIRHNCRPSEVIATTDAGHTWHLAGTIPAVIPKLGLGTSGITEIRFATAKVGWAFAPGLFLTTDGGRTWKRGLIPGAGKQVLSLAVTRTRAYVVVSPCAYQAGLCGTRNVLTAWRTGLAATHWIRMPVKLRANVAADVAAYGSTVYVVDPLIDRVSHAAAQLAASTDAGRHFATRPTPCTSAENYTLIQAVPYSTAKVALLCDGNPGFSKAVKAVYRSSDTARHDSYAGTMGPYGIQAELAVSPTGNLLVASWSDGSFIYVNDTGGTRWYRVIASGDGGAGFNDPTYLTGKVAWVVGAPASMFADYGKLLVSRDAGRHWSFVTP